MTSEKMCIRSEIKSTGNSVRIYITVPTYKFWMQPMGYHGNGFVLNSTINNCT